MANQITLPNKPSDLLQMALDDTIKAYEHPDYLLNMDEWHHPSLNRPCSVCMAGAIMAFGLGAKNAATPSCFPEWFSHLLAIDEFRTNNLDSAFCELGLEGGIPGAVQDAYKPVMAERYPDKDPSTWNEFLEAWRHFIAVLNEVGL